MKFLQGLCLLLLGVSSALAQSELEGETHRLPEAEAVKTISMNPEYLVFGELLAEENQKLPLLISSVRSGSEVRTTGG